MPFTARGGQEWPGAGVRLGRSPLVSSPRPASLVPRVSGSSRPAALPDYPGRHRLLPPCSAVALALRLPPGLAGTAVPTQSTAPVPTAIPTWNRHLFHPQKEPPPGHGICFVRKVAFFVQRRDWLGREKPLQLVRTLSPPGRPGSTIPVPGTSRVCMVG